MKPLDILVVGGGMYVTGRGADGSHGTVMPALLEARRAGTVGQIGVVTTRSETAQGAAAVTSALAADMGIDGACAAYPQSGSDTAAFLSAASDFKPDAVIVSVPDDKHADVCVPLIEMGLHCLVVKPMADGLENARAMRNAAAKARVVAQVEFHKRLDESNLLLRDAVRGGRIGTPLYAVIEYSQRKIIPRDVFRQWSVQSNIFQYLGVHYVDLIQWATGYEPARVTAWGQKRYLTDLSIDTWDSMQVVIEWRGGEAGFVSTHITNWIDPDETSAMSDQKINMVGTKGRFQADQKNRGVQLVTDGRGVEDLNPYFTAAWRNDAGGLTFEGYGIRSVQQFLHDVAEVMCGETSVADLEQRRPSFSACVASTAVVEAAKASIENASLPMDIKI